MAGSVSACRGCVVGTGADSAGGSGGGVGGFGGWGGFAGFVGAGVGCSPGFDGAVVCGGGVVVVERLLEVGWSPVPLGGGRVGDGVVVWEPGSGVDGVVSSVYAATHEVLGVLQSWLAGDGSGVLVVLTRGAVGWAGEQVTDLAGAAVWGLVRSAQAEHPGRVVLVDSDGSLDVGEVIGCGETQLVVRSGVAHAARLTPERGGGVGIAGRAVGGWAPAVAAPWKTWWWPRPRRWSAVLGRCGWRWPRWG